MSYKVYQVKPIEIQYNKNYKIEGDIKTSIKDCGFFTGFDKIKKFVHDNFEMSQVATHGRNCFYFITAHILNAEEYNFDMSIIEKYLCDCDLNVITKSDYLNEFTGRDNWVAERGDVAWVFDEWVQTLKLCTVLRRPANKQSMESQSQNNTEHLGDSYVVRMYEESADFHDIIPADSLLPEYMIDNMMAAY